MTEPTETTDTDMETNTPSMRGDLLGILAIMAASAITFAIASGL